jgi:hypothetical protein
MCRERKRLLCYHKVSLVVGRRQNQAEPEILLSSTQA